MALNRFFIKGMFLCLILFLLAACGNPQENEARKTMQEFETWLDEQSQKSGAWQPQEWQQVKDHYLAFEAEMETRAATLSDESKQRYHSLKARFKEWEAEVNREQEALSANVQIAWRNKLLGVYADTSAITADNIREAYTLFMENVRKQYREWTQPDWEKTERVYHILTERKDQLGEDVPVSGEIKIKALQAEFETLRAGDEVKEAVN